MAEARGTKKAPQEIETLRKRNDDLRDKKIQNETALDGARKRLQELQREAKKEWDTSDVKELEAKLASMKEENEKRRRDYQERLDDIEAKLKAVDAQYSEKSK